MTQYSFLVDGTTKIFLGPVTQIFYPEERDIRRLETVIMFVSEYSLSRLLHGHCFRNFRPQIALQLFFIETSIICGICKIRMLFHVA